MSSNPTTEHYETLIRQFDLDLDLLQTAIGNVLTQLQDLERAMKIEDQERERKIKEEVRLVKETCEDMMKG